MHELSIAQAIVESARRAAEENGISRIAKLTLRVGSFSGVVEEALRFAFEVASQGTPAEGAILEIKNIPLTIRCSSCAASSKIHPFLFQCPSCGSRDVEILTGQELNLDTIEGE